MERVQPQAQEGGDLSFAQLLKQYRESVRMSQSRLAEASGFDHSYVSRLESGNRMPTREAVTKLADALELSGSQRDKLFATAGFMPQRVESLLADEPILTEVFQLLQSDEVPEAVQRDVRQMLALVVKQARLAARAWPSGPDSSPAPIAAD
ncbi:MAG: helix-turn-helix transcriptional regulator [Thermomicrobiaceae bacterium]|nr:helix-turn-helix transcriptional regulator [Thermomicrobiaceae bacterium]